MNTLIFRQDAPRRPGRGPDVLARRSTPTATGLVHWRITVQRIDRADNVLEATTSKIVRQTDRKQQQIRQVCSANSASRSMVAKYSSAHSAMVGTARAASQRCTVRSLTSRTAARSFCNRSMALRRRANSVPAMRPSIRRVEGEFNRTYPGSTTLSDVAVFVRAGARRHIAVLIENPMSGHENVSGTVDQPVTDAGHILAKRGVAVRRRTIVAVRRPIKIAVVYRGSLVNAMQAVIACRRNADRAGLDEERSDRDANHKRKAFVERHRALGVGPPKPMAGAIAPFRQEKNDPRPPTYCAPQHEDWTRTNAASLRLRKDLDSNESGRGQGQRPRQRRAIQAYANRAGYKVVAWFDDGDLKGADPIDIRKGFAEMMEAIAANGCRTIIVETANRFARDLIVQETGFQRLKAAGSHSLRPIRLIALPMRRRPRCSFARSWAQWRSSTNQ